MNTTYQEHPLTAGIDTNCYAGKNPAKGCAVLTVKSCAEMIRCTGSKCTFFKTPAEKREHEKAANALLRALPPEQQSSISATYYRGKMPWNRET
jgi:hypothetical protein